MGITRGEAQDATEFSIEVEMNRRPAASFPASIAVTRVQGAEYSSYNMPRGRGNGKMRVVGLRDAELKTELEIAGLLPQVRGVASLNSLIVPEYVESLHDLRRAAAQVQADVLLVYTFDTQFWDRETTIPALGTLTLGLFPNERVRVMSTASAAFVDVRSGFVYGLCEASHESGRITNAWNTSGAVDATRREVERATFRKLHAELVETWKGIAERYGQPGS
jgi:hypothetical protein